MNSLLYLGDNFKAARRAYDAARPGIDMWGNENAAYGVILSVWRGPGKYRGEYVVKCQKGL
jgi:hypothetical protein